MLLEASGENVELHNTPHRLCPVAVVGRRAESVFFFDQLYILMASPRISSQYSSLGWFHSARFQVISFEAEMTGQSIDFSCVSCVMINRSILGSDEIVCSTSKHSPRSSHI